MVVEIASLIQSSASAMLDSYQAIASNFEFFNSTVAAFIGGFIATLTPCVYPLIPITLSVVGAGKESSRIQALSRAALFCLGIFISYALLGIVAVYSGSFFGAIWSQASFRMLLGVAICCYALVSLDLIHIRTKGELSQFAASLNGNSAIGAFAAGSVSGILAAPCTGPLLATILTLAATSTSPGTGITLLLAYAAGFSLPFFILSLSPRFFRLAPKSGPWLYGVKFLIGASLLTLGAYYLLEYQLALIKPFFEIHSSLILFLAVPILFLAIFLAIKSYLRDSRSLRLFASLSVLTLSIIIISGSSSSKAPEMPVDLNFYQSLKNADSRKVATVVDFTADWCVKCKELERDVFSKEDVRQALQSFEFLSIDLSSISEEEKILQKRYGIRGLPAILFLCPDGSEIMLARINEVISDKDFHERLAQAKAALKNCSGIF